MLFFAVAAVATVRAELWWQTLPDIALPVTSQEHGYVLGPWNQDGSRILSGADEIYNHSIQVVADRTEITSIKSDLVSDPKFDWSYKPTGIQQHFENGSFFFSFFSTYYGTDTLFGIGLDFDADVIDELGQEFRMALYYKNYTLERRDLTYADSNGQLQLLPIECMHTIPVPNDEHEEKLIEVNTWTNLDLNFAGIGKAVFYFTNTGMIIAFNEERSVLAYINNDNPNVVEVRGMTALPVPFEDVTYTFPFYVEHEEHHFVFVFFLRQSRQLCAITKNQILIYEPQPNNTDAYDYDDETNIEKRHSLNYTTNRFELIKCSVGLQKSTLACTAISYSANDVTSTRTKPNCVLIYTILADQPITLTAVYRGQAGSFFNQNNSNWFHPQTPHVAITQFGYESFDDVSVFSNATNSFVAATYFTKVENVTLTRIALLYSEPATPTNAPTKSPTEAPTEAPTDAPTKLPTDAPTDASTTAPTFGPELPPSTKSSSSDTTLIIAITVPVVVVVFVAAVWAVKSGAFTAKNSRESYALFY